MAKYIALLRAVSVGGTGKLSMSDLRAMRVDAKFSEVCTCIGSGNVVFESGKTAKKVKADLEARLIAHAGFPIGVVVRTVVEMAAILNANPFPKAAPNNTVAIFLDGPPPADARGIGKSKLKIASAKTGTARNMNTIAKLARMAANL